MTKFKLLTAGLIAAAMLASPVVAREHHPSAQRLAQDAYASAPQDAYASGPYGAPYVAGRFCTPAPRVGAFASQPWDNDTPCEPSPAY